MILALVDAGMDVARLNFSHGDYADHKIAYERVRAASDATGRAVGVLGDLQGPRSGSDVSQPGPLLGRRRIDPDHRCRLRRQPRRVSTTYKRLAKDAVVGDRVLVDDGIIGLVSTPSKATT